MRLVAGRGVGGGVEMGSVAAWDRRYKLIVVNCSSHRHKITANKEL